MESLSLRSVITATIRVTEGIIQFHLGSALTIDTTGSIIGASLLLPPTIVAHTALRNKDRQGEGHS
jgi:hypothetical protein